MLDKIIAIDKKLFLFLNGINSPFWDHIMWFFSGKLEWIPLYIILILLIIFKYRKRSIVVILAVVLVIVLADQLSVKAFKLVFERLRPCHDPDLSSQVHIVNNYRGGLYGFVSSHAANVFGLATILSLLIKSSFFRVFIFTWASLVSYSRIYLGVHYPGDIIGGALLGAACGIAVYLLLQLYQSKYTRKKEAKSESG